MLRELDTRTHDGLTVSLLWEDSHNVILIDLSHEDMNIDEFFPVPNEDAMDAFMHPFTYLDRYASNSTVFLAYS